LDIYVKYFYSKKDIFIDIFLFLSDNGDMEGLTIDEMAEILGVKRQAIEKRLKRLGIEPLTKSAVYDKSALEVIRDVPGKGRPRKQAGEDKPENTI
jgi:predicted ArsR family transcriptional regulator